MLSVHYAIKKDNIAYSDLLYPRDRPYTLLTSYERGGVSLFDPIQGLTGYIWQAVAELNEDTGIYHIFIQRVDLPKNTRIELLTVRNVTQIDITFDQNMRPCLTYMADNTVFLYYYDSVAREYIITSFNGAKDPKISLDDKRRENVHFSNVVFAYMRGKSLYMRLQKDRYQIEYHLHTFDCRRKLWRIGMGRNYRFLFYVR